MKDNTTINQIIDTFRAIAVAHEQVQSFHIISSQNMFPESKATKYPALMVAFMPEVALAQRQMKLKFRFWVVDVIIEDGSNEAEVSSDCLRICQDVIAQLNQVQYDDRWQIDLTATATGVDGKFDDLVSGWFIDLTFNVASLQDSCQVPSTLSPSGEKGCAPVTIYDTAGRTLAVIDSGGTIIIPDVPVYDSLGTLLHLVKAEQSQVISDSKIKRSDLSDILSIKAENYRLLSELFSSLLNTDLAGLSSAQLQYIVQSIITNPNYCSWLSDAQKAAIIACGPITTYNYPIGKETTSFRTGDAAWVSSNYFNQIPSGKKPGLTDFLTLLDNNVFGNKNRFTDILGGQSYSTAYVIDNFTGLGITKNYFNADTWPNAIDAAHASSLFGFNDYFIPSISQLHSILFNQNLNYSPFNNNDNHDFWTSNSKDTDPNNYAIALRKQPGTDLYVDNNKASVSCWYYFFRKHF